MDESIGSATSGASRAQDSGGGGGGSGSGGGGQQFVIDPGGLKVASVVRFAKTTEDGGLGCLPLDNAHVRSLGRAFQEYLQKYFEEEGLHSLRFSDELFGVQFKKNPNSPVLFVGHVCYVSDNAGRFAVIYYTLKEKTCRVGTLGYYTEAKNFFTRLLPNDTIPKKLISGLNKHFTSEYQDDPDFNEMFARIRANSLYTAAFEYAFPSADDHPDRHPYAHVLAHVRREILTRFKTLHASLIGTDSEPLKARDQPPVLFAFRICHYACGGLRDLEKALFERGGEGERSMNYFDSRRISNWLGSHLKSVELKSSIMEFINFVDMSVFSIFVNGRLSILFSETGKSSWMTTEREERVRVRARGRRAADSEEVDDEDDLMDSSDLRTNGDIEEAEDGLAEFDADLEARLSDFIQYFAGEVRKRICTHVLTRFNACDEIDRESEEKQLALIKTLKAINDKVSVVGNSSLVSNVIPDFLDDVMPRGGHFSGISAHLGVLRARFPECVWLSPRGADGAHQAIKVRYELFLDSLVDVTHVAEVSKLDMLRASKLILSALGETCTRGQEIKHAVQLVLNGRLGSMPTNSRRGRGRGRARGGAGQAIQGALTATGSIQDGDDAPEATESAQSVGGKRRMTTSNQRPPPGGIIAHGLNTDSILEGNSRKRQRSAVQTFKSDGLTMMSSLQYGFDIPHLSEYCRSLSFSDPGSTGLEGSLGVSAGAGSHGTGQGGSTHSLPPVVQPPSNLECPDPRDTSIADRADVILPYSKCEVVLFETPAVAASEFPGRVFLFVGFPGKDPDVMESLIYVEDKLILQNSRAGNVPNKRVGVKLLEGLTFMFNVNVEARGRKRNPRTPVGAGASGDPGRSLEGGGHNIDVETGAPVLDFLRLPATAPAVGQGGATGAPRVRRADAAGQAIELDAGGGGGVRCSSCSRDVIVNLHELSYILVRPHPSRQGDEYQRTTSDMLFQQRPMFRPQLPLSARGARFVTVRDAAATKRVNRSSVMEDEGERDGDYQNHDADDAADADSADKVSAIVAAGNPVTRTWADMQELIEAAQGDNWMVLNEACEIGFVHNSETQTVLIAPTGKDTTYSGLSGFYNFLKGCPKRDRMVHETVLIQHVQNSTMKPISEMSLHSLLSSLFDAREFKVFKKILENGKFRLIDAACSLAEYLERVLPGFVCHGRWNVVSLFQVCPCSSVGEDPCRHVHATCPLKPSGSGDELDTRRLDDCLNAKGRFLPELDGKKLITPAIAVTLPVPICRCCFNDIPSKDYCIRLLTADDPIQRLISRKSGMCYYAAEIVGDRYKVFAIESGARMQRRATEGAPEAPGGDGAVGGVG